jgi:cysteine desulfurase family protein (TIGR01976 family)
VIDAVASYLRHTNANSGGDFDTSRRSDEILADAHTAMAAFLGAASADEIKFGANMTTLTLAASRSIGATLRDGDEIVVTVLDHEANVNPWQHVARERGLMLRTVDIRSDDCTLALDDLDRKITDRTRVVAVGLASNAVGTINPVPEIARRAHAVGALVYVDAVHYAPHGPIDVAALDADMLACSVYKFFGPHVGVLWGRADLFARLPVYGVRPAHDPWETGTQNHEGIAGALAALDYLTDVGVTQGEARGDDRAGALRAAMTAIAAYERSLSDRLLRGLAGIEGLRIWGIADPTRVVERVPTVAVTLHGWTPDEVARELASRGIFVWSGHFYAQALIERLGLAASGGVVRLGFAHYNTRDEVDRLLDELRDLSTARRHQSPMAVGGSAAPAGGT